MKRKKKDLSRPLYKKSFLLSPPPPLLPPRHVSCEKARWRAVQEPTVPGLSIYNDPRSHKPLPSQWITFSNSTHSKFIYLQLVCTHTHSYHTHTHTDSPGRHGGKSEAECCHPEVQPINVQSQVLQLPMKCTVQWHACMRRLACLPWTEASMLTVLSAAVGTEHYGHMAASCARHFICIYINF